MENKQVKNVNNDEDYWFTLEDNEWNALNLQEERLAYIGEQLKFQFDSLDIDLKTLHCSVTQVGMYIQELISKSSIAKKHLC